MLYGVLVVSDPALGERAFLGMEVALRSAVALADANVSEILLVQSSHGGQPQRAELPAWTRDARLRVPVRCFAGEPGEALVLHASSVVEPALLRELSTGDALHDAQGACVAARVRLQAGDEPWARALSASPRAFASSGERYALALRDPAALPQARRLLFASLVKPSDGPVSRHLNRHVSRAITRVLLPLRFTPNMVTVLVALSGFFAAHLATSPNYLHQLYGAALYQFHSILDGCDGEIARLTKRFGKHGALIDSLVDDLANFSFFIGLSVGVARSLQVRWPVICAGITGSAYLWIIALQYGVVLRQNGNGDKTKFWDAGGSGAGPRAFAIARAFLRRDVFVLLILGMVALNLSEIMVAIFPFAALGTLISTVGRMRALRA